MKQETLSAAPTGNLPDNPPNRAFSRLRSCVQPAPKAAREPQTGVPCLPKLRSPKIGSLNANGTRGRHGSACSRLQLPVAQISPRRSVTGFKPAFKPAINQSKQRFKTPMFRQSPEPVPHGPDRRRGSNSGTARAATAPRPAPSRNPGGLPSTRPPAALTFPACGGTAARRGWTVGRSAA